MPPENDGFASLDAAVDAFVADGEFPAAEGDKIKNLSAQKHRQLASIWKVYEVIKQRDDLLHSIKVFLGIAKKRTAGGVPASAQGVSARPAQPQVSAPPARPMADNNVAATAV